jgi:hypothetical protein
MPLLTIEFNASQSRQTRKKTLEALRVWMQTETFSPVKRALLEAVIAYADKRFTRFTLKPTNKNRIQICEAIFKLATAADDVFYGHVRAQAESITDTGSQFKKNLEAILRQYQAQPADGHIGMPDMELRDLSIPKRPLKIDIPVSEDSWLQGPVSVPIPVAMPVKKPTSVITIRQQLARPRRINTLSIDELIQSFEADTERLQEQDLQTAFILVESLMGGLVGSVVFNNFYMRIILALTLIGLAQNLYARRERLSYARNEKLELLYAKYKSLTANGAAATYNQTVTKILRVIAPYINTEELTPWVNPHVPLASRFQGVSQEFADIIEQPPHVIVVVQAELIRPKSILGLGLVALSDGLTVAADNYVDEVKDDMQKRLAAKCDKHLSMESIIPMGVATFTKALYGRSPTIEVLDEKNEHPTKRFSK